MLNLQMQEQSNIAFKFRPNARTIIVVRSLFNQAVNLTANIFIKNLMLNLL